MGCNDVCGGGGVTRKLCSGLQRTQPTRDFSSHQLQIAEHEAFQSRSEFCILWNSQPFNRAWQFSALWKFDLSL
jgi:hypothetical protein